VYKVRKIKYVSKVGQHQVGATYVHLPERKPSLSASKMFLGRMSKVVPLVGRERGSVSARAGMRAR
jgi:hypothetical protein